MATPKKPYDASSENHLKNKCANKRRLVMDKIKPTLATNDTDLKRIVKINPTANLETLPAPLKLLFISKFVPIYSPKNNR